MASTLNPTGMDATSGQFKIAGSGDTVNVLQNTSTSIQKGNGSGGLSNAASSTDYAPATSGTSILKGNGAGGFTAAVQGTDYVSTIFSATVTATVTNTVTETSAIGTGVGSKTLAANFLTVGRTLRISGSGIYSAAAVAPGNLTVKIKLGSTVIATTTLGALLSGASNLGYQFEAEVVCRTTGVSGTVITSGSIDYATTSTGTRSFGDLNNGGATSTIDTTSSQVLDVTVTWQTASTSNIVSNIIAVIEVLW